MGAEIINGDLGGDSGNKLLQVFDTQVGFKSIGVIVIDMRSFFRGQVTEVVII
jgi:hypothetical protein